MLYYKIEFFFLKIEESEVEILRNKYVLHEDYNNSFSRFKLTYFLCSIQIVSSRLNSDFNVPFFKFLSFQFHRINKLTKDYDQ